MPKVYVSRRQEPGRLRAYYGKMGPGGVEPPARGLRNPRSSTADPIGVAVHSGHPEPPEPNDRSGRLRGAGVLVNGQLPPIAISGSMRVGRNALMMSRFGLMRPRPTRCIRPRRSSSFTSRLTVFLVLPA